MSTYYSSADYPSSNSNGMNPMYQASSIVSSTTIHTPSEYDEIRQSVDHTGANGRRSVTRNVLYESCTPQSALRHPTLVNSSTEKFIQSDENDNNRKHCKCSPDAVLISFTLLSFLLSGVAIVLILLLWFGVISTDSNTTLTQVDIHATTSSNNNTTSGLCDCLSPDYSSLFYNLTMVNNSITNIAQELKQFKSNKMTSNVNINQRLYKLISLVEPINESVQGLVPQSDTRSPDLTRLNLPASITVDHSNCGISLSTCSLNPFDSFLQFPGICSTSAPYKNATHIIASASCSVVPLNDPLPDRVVATQQVQNSSVIPPDSTIIERLSISDHICLCFNYNSVSATCQSYVTHCPYPTLNTTANVNIT